MHATDDALNLVDDHNLNAFSLFGSEESLMETMACRTLKPQHKSGASSGSGEEPFLSASLCDHRRPNHKFVPADSKPSEHIVGPPMNAD
jgi:hypothetical protein